MFYAFSFGNSLSAFLVYVSLFSWYLIPLIDVNTVMVALLSVPYCTVLYCTTVQKSIVTIDCFFPTSPLRTLVTILFCIYSNVISKRTSINFNYCFLVTLFPNWSIILVARSCPDSSNGRHTKAVVTWRMETHTPSVSPAVQVPPGRWTTNQWTLVRHDLN